MVCNRRGIISDKLGGLCWAGHIHGHTVRKDWRVHTFGLGLRDGRGIFQSCICRWVLSRLWVESPAMSSWRCEIHVHTKFCLAKKRFKLKGTWCLLHAPSDAHEEFSNVLGASRFTHQQFYISLLIMAVYVLRWRQMCHMLRGPGVLRNKDTSLITVIQVAGIAAIRLFSRHSRTMVTRFYIVGHNDVMGWHLNFTSKILRIWDWVLLRRCSELFPRESWTEVISKDRNILQPIYWKW